VQKGFFVIIQIEKGERFMGLDLLGSFNFTWDFWFAIISIIMINIILSGDNAVIIAMAVRTLPKHQRLQGIAFGAGAAVVLRIIFTFFAAQLLQIQFVKFVGGAVILWIAVKLLVEAAPCDEEEKQCKTIWQAVWVILVADVTMSLDNVLAVAGASAGNMFLLVFGLGLSIPIVVFASNLLSALMDRYPIILYLGAAILGRVGGEMLVTDPFVEATFHPSAVIDYGVQAFFTVGVIVAGKVWLRCTRPSLQEVKVDLPAETVLNPDRKE
jgi:YjbE family integral membrane protein